MVNTDTRVCSTGKAQTIAVLAESAKSFLPYLDQYMAILKNRSLGFILGNALSRRKYEHRCAIGTDLQS